MLVLACFVVMLIVAYTAMREGLILAFVNFFSVMVAILISFNVWPYLANALETEMRSGMFDALEDCLPLFIWRGNLVFGIIAEPQQLRTLPPHQESGLGNVGLA